MSKSAFHLQALVFSLGSMDAFINGAGFPYRLFSVFIALSTVLICSWFNENERTDEQTK